MGYCFFGKRKWCRLKAILCFIFYKNETTIAPKKSSEKLEISIVKREAAGIFVVGWCFLEKYTTRPFTRWYLKKNFRMPKGDFKVLVAEWNPLSSNHRSLNTEKNAVITLYYLKDTVSIGMIANSFGVAICTVSVVIAEACEAVSTYMEPKFISLPKKKDEMMVKASEFEAKFGIKQPFACIGGNHIPIKFQVQNSQDYFCYKQFYSFKYPGSMWLQRLFHWRWMWPGNVYDAKVFINSLLNQILQNNLS